MHKLLFGVNPTVSNSERLNELAQRPDVLNIFHLKAVGGNIPINIEVITSAEDEELRALKLWITQNFLVGTITDYKVVGVIK